MISVWISSNLESFNDGLLLIDLLYSRVLSSIFFYTFGSSAKSQSNLWRKNGNPYDW